MASLKMEVMMLLVIALSTSNCKPTEHEVTVPKPALENGHAEGAKKDEVTDLQRSKRQWQTWSSTNVIYDFPQGYSLFQPQYYQIKRPYVIPVFGSAGRIPIYLPPQPLYFNPGYPFDNPPKKFPGVSYLPPSTENPNKNETTTMETDTKFIEDGPVWDQVSHKTPDTNSRPTRPTRKPGQQAVTHPPLVHKEATIPETGGKSADVPIGPVRTTPQPPKETPVTGSQPSRCVWAIISCCSANSEHISYSCFEQLGCTGAFWGNSPCESEFARSAISAASNYYNAK